MSFDPTPAVEHAEVTKNRLAALFLAFLRDRIPSDAPFWSESEAQECDRAQMAHWAAEFALTTALPPPAGTGEVEASWRIAGKDSHFGPYVVVEGVPHDQIVLCYWRNQLQPIHLRLPGQAYVADLLRLMDENHCDEVAIIPARHKERISLTRAALSSKDKGK